MSRAEKPTHPRKLEIVEAAIACFLERGFHQTGVRDIAQAAGISLGNLYNHFKGKDAVLAFIAELDGVELSAFARGLEETSDPRAALEEFIVDYGAYAARPENALLGVELLAEALRNPEIAEVFEAQRRRLIAALAGCLDRGAASGVFAPLSDRHAVACMMLDALEGHGLRRVAEGAEGKGALEVVSAVLLSGVSAPR